MNLSHTTALTRDLKPFDVAFLSTDDSRFSWLKQQFLKSFEDWFTKIEVGPGVYEKFIKKQMFISSRTYKGHKIHGTYCHRTSIKSFRFA